MSKRVNGKKGNRVRRRCAFQPSKVRGADNDTVQGRWIAQQRREKEEAIERGDVILGRLIKHRSKVRNEHN